MKIQIGDDITVSGKVVFIYSEYYIMIKSKNGNKYLINVNDIKTHKPNNMDKES